MQDLNIALVQSPLLWEDPFGNRNYFQEKISNIQNADLIILPEMFNTGFSMKSEKLAEVMHGDTMIWMKEQAQIKDVVICGSLIIKEDRDYYNRLIWMRPDGSFEKYDKRHLFRMANEDEYFTAGKERLIVELKGWKICPLICYDLRFPIWSRNKFETDRKTFAKAEYDLLLYIANWPAARVSAWSVLLRGRAIENQAFVAGLNRTGADGNKIAYNGMSAIVDAKGEEVVIGESKSECILQTQLNYKELEEFRKKFPVGMDADKFTIEI